jgi:soluble cytochrome b562
MNRWKTALFGTLAAAALLAGPLVAPPAAVAAAQDAKEDEKSTVKDLDTELAKQMEVIEEGMKKLRRTLRKAEDNPTSLEWIDKIDKAAVKSRDLIPAMAARIPEAERAKWVENYKKDMDTFIKSVAEMKAAVKDGKNDKAQEVYKTLKEHEDKGHQKYTE